MFCIEGRGEKMKQVKRILFVIPVVFILIHSCSLRTLEDNTKEYLITDRNSGKVLNKYEYDKIEERLVRVVSYESDQEARSVTEFDYDADGHLSRTIVKSRGFGQVDTRVINYAVSEEYDEQNRLVKTIVTADDGTETETRFGYDASGKLRGAAQRSSDGSILMRDYE